MMSVPFFTGRIIDKVFGHSISSSEATNPESDTDSHKTRLQTAMANLRTYMFGLAALFAIGAMATFGRVYLMNFASNICKMF